MSTTAAAAMETKLSPDKQLMLDNYKKTNPPPDEKDVEGLKRYQQMITMFISTLNHIQYMEEERSKEMFLWRVKEDFIKVRRELKDIKNQINEFQTKFSLLKEEIDKTDKECEDSIVKILDYKFTYPYPNQ